MQNPVTTATRALYPLRQASYRLDQRVLRYGQRALTTGKVRRLMLIRLQSEDQGFPVAARALLLWLCACTALAGCAAPPELLNSERITAKFGSYQVTLVSQDDAMRVSSLASVEGTEPVTRTLAIVLFEPRRDEYIGLHRRIIAGSSIGSTFRDAGWKISKPLLYTGSFTVRPDIGIVSQLMKIPLPADVALHAYRFNVSKDDRTLTYAVIIELHHPDYLDVRELQGIYGSRRDPGDEAALLELTGRVLAALPAPR